MSQMVECLNYSKPWRLAHRKALILLLPHLKSQKFRLQGCSVLVIVLGGVL